MIFCSLSNVLHSAMNCFAKYLHLWCWWKEEVCFRSHFHQFQIGGHILEIRFCKYVNIWCSNFDFVARIELAKMANFALEKGEIKIYKAFHNNCRRKICRKYGSGHTYAVILRQTNGVLQMKVCSSSEVNSVRCSLPLLSCFCSALALLCPSSTSFTYTE